MKCRLILLFLVFYSYAVIRYHFGKNIPFLEFVFILNKALAWFGFTLIGLSILPISFFEKYNFSRKTLGILGFCIAATHTVISLLLLNPERFERFYFQNQYWNLEFYMVGLTGLISIAIYLIVFLTSLDVIKVVEKVKYRILKLGYKTFLISILHPFFVGNKTWFEPSKWPYYLPPITLLSVLTGLFLISSRLILLKREKQ